MKRRERLLRTSTSEDAKVRCHSNQIACAANDTVIAQWNCLSAETRPSGSDERLHILGSHLVPAALELREKPVQSKVSIELLANSDPEKQPMTPLVQSQTVLRCQDERHSRVDVA